MRTVTVSPGAQRAEQLHRLSVLLEQALLESNELHHRIREIQLRIAELCATEETGRPVAIVRAMA
jgi:hypothetical protein